MTDKIVKLKAKDVIKNARKFMAKNKLQYQVSKFCDGESCKYTSGAGVRCAIGASLTIKQAKKFDMQTLTGGDSSLPTLFKEGFVDLDYPAILFNLQRDHDHLVGSDYSITEKNKEMKKILRNAEMNISKRIKSKKKNEKN
jgi:hypothetical protein